MESNITLRNNPGVENSTMKPAPEFFPFTLAIGALVVALFLPVLAMSQSRGRGPAAQRIKFCDRRD